MENQQDDKSREEILQKIKSGQVSMHSQTFLVWRTSFWVLAILLLLAAAAFLVSFMVFALQASRVWDLPGFGRHGLTEFLAYFPWLFVPAVLLFIWLSERFVRKYSFAYRLPVLYVSSVSVVLIIGGSFLCIATSLHSRVNDFAQGRGLPVAGRMYNFFGNRHPDDFYMGQVEIVKPDGCALMTRDGKQVSIMVNKDTRIYGDYNLMPGDYVEAVGIEDNGNVIATDIRKIMPMDFRLVPAPYSN